MTFSAAAIKGLTRWTYDTDARDLFAELSVVGWGERRELDDLVRYLKGIDQWEGVKSLIIDRYRARQCRA